MTPQRLTVAYAFDAASLCGLESLGLTRMPRHRILIRNGDSYEALCWARGQRS